MPTFKKLPSLDQLNQMCVGTAVSHMGIQFTQMNEDSISASLPVDSRTIQPAGLLHGGCHALLAETLAGVASFLLLEGSSQMPVGIEVTAKHVKSAKSGTVIGNIKASHLGKRLHLWEIKILNEKGELLSMATVTNQIIDKT
jgi:1,4-dihydroxy-2-naphthoyl-CoA hydrolase